MDAINPKHYQSFSNGAEAIDILENLVSNCSNTAKYAIRSGRLDGDNKTDTLSGRLQDMKKAKWYATREVERLEKLIAEEENSKPEKTWQDWDKEETSQEWGEDYEIKFTFSDVNHETLNRYFGGEWYSPEDAESEESEHKESIFRAVLPYLCAKGFEAQWGVSKDETIIEADLTVRMEPEDYERFHSTNHRLSHPAYQDYRWILSCEKK